MKYRQIMYLDAVVQHGSINQAAKALRVSQPNLSRDLTQLEEEIGVQLLERNTSGIRLTVEGQRFWNLAHDIVCRTIALENAYKPKNDTPSTVLQLATFPQRITQVIIAQLIRQIQNPSYKITILNLSLKEIIDQVCQHQCELGIIFLTPMEEESYLHIIRANHLEYHEVACAPPCINISRYNPLFERDSISLSELEPYPMARYIEDEISSLDYRTVDFGRFRKSVFFDSDEAIVSFVASTPAFKLGYIWSENEYLHMGVRCIPLQDTIGLLHLGWVCRHAEGLSPAARNFIELFEKRYGRNRSLS